MTIRRVTAALITTVIGLATLGAIGPTADAGPSAGWQFGVSHRVLPLLTIPQGLSCPTTSFCLATDETGEYAVEHSGSWSVPERLGTGTELYSASCVDASLCFATVAGVNGELGIYRWDGKRWSSTAVPADLASDFGGGVACVPRVKRCLFFGYSGAAFWTGRFSTPFEPDRDAPPVRAGYYLESGDCSSSRLCALLDSGGHVVIWRGHGWSEPHELDSGADIISCGGDNFCVGSDGARAWSWHADSGWAGARRFGPKGHRMFASDIACPSADRCIAVGSGGTSELAGSSWRAVRATRDPSSLSFVQCPTAGACDAIDEGGVGLAGDISQLRPTSSVLTPTAATSISCPTTTWCAVANDTGQVATGRLGHLRRRTVGRGIDAWRLSVSCTSPTFCLTVSGSGALSRWNGQRWTRLSSIVEASVPSSAQVLSCASRTLCGFAENDELATISSDGTVTDQAVSGNVDLAAISCPTDTFCVAVDRVGHAWTWNGKVWSSRVRILSGIASGNGLDSVSCSGASHCVAGGAGPHGGVAAEWNGSSWDRINVPNGLLDSVDCYSASSCLTSDGDVIVGRHLGGTTTIPRNHEAAGELGDLLQLSCPTSHRCYALDSDSGVAVGSR